MCNSATLAAKAGQKIGYGFAHIAVPSSSLHGTFFVSYVTKIHAERLCVGTYLTNLHNGNPAHVHKVRIQSKFSYEVLHQISKLKLNGPLVRARVNVDRNRRCKGCGPWVLIGPAIGYTQTEWRPKGQRKKERRSS
jgi:hypothetical protein